MKQEFEYEITVGTVNDLPVSIRDNEYLREYTRLNYANNSIAAKARREPSSEDSVDSTGKRLFRGEWKVDLYTVVKVVNTTTQRVNVATRNSVIRVDKGSGIDNMSIAELEAYLAKLKGEVK